MTKQEITNLFEAVDFRCSLLSNDLVGGGNDTIPCHEPIWGAGELA